MARTSCILLLGGLRELKCEEASERGPFAVLIDVRCETASLPLSVSPIIFDFPIRFLSFAQVHILYPLHLNHCIYPSPRPDRRRRRRRHQEQVQLNQRRNIQHSGRLKKELKLGRHSQRGLAKLAPFFDSSLPFKFLQESLNRSSSSKYTSRHSAGIPLAAQKEGGGKTKDEVAASFISSARPSLPS